MATADESVRPPSSDLARGSPGINPTVVLMTGILGVAVVFSLGAAAVAIYGADPELPDEYHWEGAQFDRDVALAQRASDLSISATVQLAGASGVCRVVLHSSGAAPAGLTLALIHATEPQLDRRVRLARRGDGYEAQCGPLAASHYHLELSDEAGTWRIREEVHSADPVLRLTTQRPRP